MGSVSVLLHHLAVHILTSPTMKKRKTKLKRKEMGQHLTSSLANRSNCHQPRMPRPPIVARHHSAQPQVKYHIWVVVATWVLVVALRWSSFNLWMVCRER